LTAPANELRELYQEVILDHYKRPRNFGRLPAANRRAEGYNPLCGDRVQVEAAVDGDRLTDVRFEGSGCAISTASASLMTEATKGKSVAEAEALFRRFHDLVTGDPSRRADADEELGKLAVFGGVREFPVRVKCATLAWHTLQAALDNQTAPVTTE
jgi:nitrogen fixation NifU-like protein